MPEERAVQQIRKFVMEQAGEGKKLSLSQMAKQSGLSKWHFHRVFKKTVGVTPFEYLRNERVAWGHMTAGAGDVGLWDGVQLTNGEFGLEFWNMGLDTDGSSESVSVSVSSGLRSVAKSMGSGSPLDLGLEFDDLLAWPDEVTG